MLSEPTFENTTTTGDDVRAPRNRAPLVVSWRLNVRLALWTLAIAAILAPCLFGWYKFQVRRHATAILARAKTLHEKGNWAGAATALGQYLQMRPQDAEAILLRAQNFDKLNDQPDQGQRAVSLYFEALRTNPARHDVRLRLAELLLGTRRFEEAATQAREVASALPGEVKAARILARSLREQLGPARRVEVKEVVRTYEEALARHKGDVPLSIGLAEVLRKFQDSLPAESRDTAIATADRVIDDMIALHPQDPEALLARFRYRKAYHLAGSDEDLAHAREQAPDDPDVLLASALATGNSDRAQARQYGEHLLTVASKSRRAYMTVAELYTRRNEPAEAIRVLETGTEQIGRDDLELNRALLQLLLATERTEPAREALVRIEPVFEKVEPYLPDAIRRRFHEDLDVARAQLQILDGNTAAALPALKRLATSVTESADPAETMAERMRRSQLLASAYARLGMHDRAASTFDELVRLDPRVRENRLLAANEWRLIGDYERAINHYDFATAGEADFPAAWLGLAETRLDQQLRKVAGEARDWAGVDAALKQARAKSGDVPAVLNLQAVVAIAKNDRQTALDYLHKLLAIEKLDLAMLPRIASLLQDAGAPAEADATLERYRTTGGNGELATLTAAELLRRRGDFAAAVRTLEKGIAETTDAARGLLLRQLIALEIDFGAMQSARRRLLELRHARSLDLWVYESAVDLALMAGDQADLSECERELKTVEGPSGTLWRFVQAVQLLATGTDVKTAIREATKLVGEIETARPSWPLARVLRGRIAESQERLSEATELYEQALRSGARNLTTFQWLVSALYRQNRFADAAAYIGQSGQLAATSAELASQAIPASLRAGHIDDAVRMARAAAELRPSDPAAQVWYAQTLALTGKSDASLATLRKSLQLAPQDSRVWSALVWFYTRQKRFPEARQILQDMIAKVELTATERELVLARGSDLMGDYTVAEQHYQKALAGHEKDVKLLHEMGCFYVRIDLDKALETFQQALAVDPKSSETRRMLALLLGTRGSEADWSRGLGLLTGNDKSTDDDDLRLQATLLVARGGIENVQKAVDHLTELVNKRKQVEPSDRLLLARALEDAHRIDDARKQYEATLKGGESSAFLVPYIEFLNRNKLDQAAEKKLRQLVTIDPAGYEPLAVWLAEHSRLDESLAIIVEKVAPADVARKASVIVRVLTIAASRGDPKPAQFAAAEQIFVAAFAQPDANLLLHTGVLRIMQGRNADAIVLYERALEKDPQNPSILNNLAVALSEIPERRTDALRLIDTAIAQNHNSAELLDSKALVLTNAGRYQDARDILERLCRRNHKNPRYRLHLAVALFHLQQTSSARNEIEQAVVDGLPAELLTPAERRQWRQIADQVADRS